MVCQDPVAGAAVFELWRYGCFVVFVGRFAAEGLRPLSGFCVDTGFVGILGFNFWIPGRFLIGFGCGFP